MRCLLLSAAVIVGVVWESSIPAEASPLMPGLVSANVDTTPATEVGWRRQYWRHSYPAPYAYYPPAYGYYAPPVPYAYYPPARGYYVPVPSNGDYPSDGDYADYPPAGTDYPPPDGDYGEW